MPVRAQQILSAGRATQYKWVLTLADPVALPTPPILFHSDKTVQVFGTQDADGWNTATVAVQGSTDDSVGYAACTDPQGNSLTFTNQNKIETIQENVKHIRPLVTAGALGATGIIIILTSGGPA